MYEPRGFVLRTASYDRKVQFFMEIVKGSWLICGLTRIPLHDTQTIEKATTFADLTYVLALVKVKVKSLSLYKGYREYSTTKLGERRLLQK